MMDKWTPEFGDYIECVDPKVGSNFKLGEIYIYAGRSKGGLDQIYVMDEDDFTAPTHLRFFKEFKGKKPRRKKKKTTKKSTTKK